MTILAAGTVDGGGTKAPERPEAPDIEEEQTAATTTTTEALAHNNKHSNVSNSNDNALNPTTNNLSRSNKVDVDINTNNNNNNNNSRGNNNSSDETVTAGRTNTTFDILLHKPSSSSAQDPIDQQQQQQEEEILSTTELADMIVLAQYYFNVGRDRDGDNNSSGSGGNDNDNNDQSSSSFLWWPALKFQSYQQLLKQIDSLPRRLSGCFEGIDQTTTTTTKAKHTLQSCAMLEMIDEDTMEVLVYLGRPLDEFKAADYQHSTSHNATTSSNNNGNCGIQIHSLTTNMISLKQHMVGNPPFFPSMGLYYDFHRAMDLALSLLKSSGACSSSTTGSGAANTTSSNFTVIEIQNTFMKLAKNGFNQHQKALNNARRNHDDDDENDDDDPPPILQPQGDHGNDDELHGNNHHQRQQHQRDDMDVGMDNGGGAVGGGSPMAHSVAAVSLADDSTAQSGGGLSLDGHGRRRPYPGPIQAPRLSNTMSSPIRPQESFEDVWRKHELDGWYQHLKSVGNDTSHDTSDNGCVDSNGNGDRNVFMAPNGYEFDSVQMFRQHLREEYNWTGPPPKSSAAPGTSTRTLPIRPRRSGRGTGSNQDEETTGGTRRSRASIGRYFAHLEALGWKWIGAGKNIQNHTWWYFRPECKPTKYPQNNGFKLNVDYFGDEDEIMAYCHNNNIHPPSTPSPPRHSTKQKKHSSSRSRYQNGVDTVDGSDDDEIDHSSESEYSSASGDEDATDDDVDESGYETPTDQKSSPRDPGKPLVRSPVHREDETVDEDEYYAWKNLWPRLKSGGWMHQKAKNALDDWWWIKPGGETRMERGLDYFVTVEDVTNFAKERDAKLKKAVLDRKSTEYGHEHSSTTDKSTEATSGASKIGGKRHRHSDDDGSRSKPTGSACNEENEIDRTNNKRDSRRPKLVDDRLHPCNDVNLVVASKGDNTAKWSSDPPLLTHNLVTSATRLSYSSNQYVFDCDGSVEKFSTVQEFAKAFAMRDDLVLANGSRTPQNSDEKSFIRCVHYELVPGTKSEWEPIRPLSRSETSFLLVKLGYSKFQDGSWAPPACMVEANVLDKNYATLDELFSALRPLEKINDAPGTGRRPRRGAGPITNMQMMALRLRIAEGFDGDEEADENHRDWEQRAHVHVAEADDENLSLVHSPERETADPLEELTPSRIKVGTFKDMPTDNPAPWSKDNPVAGKWHDLILKLGFQYTGNWYYCDGEGPKNFKERFISPNDIQRHLCLLGEDHCRILLRKLDNDERKAMKRFINYGTVPGQPSDWRSIRELTRNEVIQFLELLGFVRSDDGSWVGPAHLSKLPGRRFLSLGDLGRALRAVPDLVEHKEGKKRRSSRTHEEALNKYQVLALRLRIAEGLEGDDDEDDENQSLSDSLLIEGNSVDTYSEACNNLERRPTDNDNEQPAPGKEVESEKHEMSRNNVNPNGSFQSPCNRTVRKKDYDVDGICTDDEAWKYLENLGCYLDEHNFYRIRGAASHSFDTTNTLIHHLLKGTNLDDELDWKQCNLSAQEINALHRYLKYFYAFSKTNSYSPSINDAAEIAKDQSEIDNLLSQLDIQKIGDQFQLSLYATIGNIGETYTQEMLVNLIRSTKNLDDFGFKHSGKFLSRIERMAVRLWAAEAAYPLPGFHMQQGKDLSGLQNHSLVNCVSKSHEEDEAIAVASAQREGQDNSKEVPTSEVSESSDSEVKEASVDEADPNLSDCGNTITGKKRITDTMTGDDEQDIGSEHHNMHKSKLTGQSHSQSDVEQQSEHQAHNTQIDTSFREIRSFQDESDEIDELNDSFEIRQAGKTDYSQLPLTQDNDEMESSRLDTSHETDVANDRGVDFNRVESNPPEQLFEKRRSVVEQVKATAQSAIRVFGSPFQNLTEFLSSSPSEKRKSSDASSPSLSSSPAKKKSRMASGSTLEAAFNSSCNEDDVDMEGCKDGGSGLNDSVHFPETDDGRFLHDVDAGINSDANTNQYHLANGSEHDSSSRHDDLIGEEDRLYAEKIANGEMI